MRCMKRCSYDARKVNGALVSVATMAIRKVCSVRKENELFLWKQELLMLEVDWGTYQRKSSCSYFWVIIETGKWILMKSSACSSSFLMFSAKSNDVNLHCLYNMHEGCTLAKICWSTRSRWKKDIKEQLCFSFCKWRNISVENSMNMKQFCLFWHNHVAYIRFVSVNGWKIPDMINKK